MQNSSFDVYDAEVHRQSFTGDLSKHPLLAIKLYLEKQEQARTLLFLVAQ